MGVSLDELHALVAGFFLGLAVSTNISFAIAATVGPILKEFHYFSGGLAIGTVVGLFLGKLLRSIL